MSKIQIKELNRTTSEFDALNEQQTNKVVGGYFDKSAYISQFNYNSTLQIADSYYGSASNYNSTYQDNSASVYQ
ncbi:hypothetical protein [Pleurocapsa sp. PCC 7319]|uniref:hypothetical protein n=1 Tax=Pleurocapsa sp. PCC 7319 TaxID=118161 RepID=UPI0003480ECC|nr:hypothetical protein [Pleurocapsa sp. PCC 7319]